MIKIALFAGLLAVTVFIALGIRTSRRTAAGRTRMQLADRVAVNLYHSMIGFVPAAEPEPDDLDAKWATYWANSQAYDNALRADLNDYVGWAASLEERFALDCDQVVKRFAITAVMRQAELASEWGGWACDIERRADIIVEHVGGSLAAFNHELRVEIAECTETAWTEADAQALAEHVDAELLREGVSA